MSTSFRLLDSNYRMQQRPFGTNTALSNGTEHGAGGSFGSALRRQESGYGRALRILDRQARRGDANSALRAIDVRNQAMEQGMSPGILRNVDEKRGDVYGRMGAMERNRADSEMVRGLALQQAREELGVGMAGNDTKVAQNGTSVQNTSRNVTTDTMGNTTMPRTAVQGASGVQGATTMDYRPERDGSVAVSAIGTPSRPGVTQLPADVQRRMEAGRGVSPSLAPVDNPTTKFSTPSLGSRLTSGWDRFKAGVTGAVDAVTGKIPDVEPPKAQEPVGKIDGRPAQEVIKEMRSAAEPPPVQAIGGERPVEPDIMSQAKAARDLGRSWDRARAGTQFDQLTQAPETPEEKPSIDTLNRRAAMNVNRKRDLGTLGRIDAKLQADKDNMDLAKRSLKMTPTEVAKLPYEVLKLREKLL